MPYIVNLPHAHWRSMLYTKLPGPELIQPTSVSIFSLYDCPPIRRTSPTTHPLHTILLGQCQLRGLPDHTMICNRDFSQGPVACQPSTGTVLISTPVRLLILLHDEILAACRLSIIENWQRVPALIMLLPSPPASIPVEWAVQLATNDADLGSIVECINFENHHCFYAEIQELVASDWSESLFTARILGYERDPICMIHVPNDFIEPYLIAARIYTGSIEIDMSVQLLQLLDQPNIAYILPSNLSVALLTEKVVPSNLYDQHEDALAAEREQYVTETHLSTERNNLPIAVSVNTVTEEFTDISLVILNNIPRKCPTSPIKTEEDRRKAKKCWKDRKGKDLDKDL